MDKSIIDDVMVPTTMILINKVPNSNFPYFQRPLHSDFKPMLVWNSVVIPYVNLNTITNIPQTTIFYDPDTLINDSMCNYVFSPNRMKNVCVRKIYGFDNYGH